MSSSALEGLVIPESPATSFGGALRRLVEGPDPLRSGSSNSLHQLMNKKGAPLGPLFCA
jgi:hypothetical protein